MEVYPYAKVIQRVPRSDTSNRKRKISGQSVDSPRGAQVKLIEEKINEDNLSSCVAVLGKEILFQSAYNDLLVNFPRNTVDKVLNRILAKPYYGCLNYTTISKWCLEEVVNQAVNSHTILPNTDIDFEKLEKELLANNSSKRGDIE